MSNKITIVPLIIIVGGGLAFLGLPWWITAVAGMVAGLLFPTTSGKAFSVGFAAGFLLWWGSAYFFNAANNGLLAGKMGELFTGLKSWHLLSATGFIGGVLAGLGNLAGSLGRGLFSK